MWTLFLGIACSPAGGGALIGPSTAALEARIQQLEAQVAEMEALERRVEALERGGPKPDGGGPETMGMAATERDPKTGELFPTLNEEATVSCARATLEGIFTAEMGYDAAFDTFTGFENLGWGFSKIQGCDRYLAVRLETSEENRRKPSFEATVVITRGDGRGRRFQIDNQTEGPRELSRLSELEVLNFLSEPGWVGSAE